MMMNDKNKVFKPILLLIATFLMLYPFTLYATEIVDEISEGEESVSIIAEPEEHILKEKFEQEEAKPFKIMGTEIPPGESRTLQWHSVQSIGSFSVPIPVIIVNGSKPGPAICLTAAIHGDELNGIEVVREVIHNIDPEKLSGAVVGVPVVNIDGLWRKQRYIGDRRDLNRFFPGKPDGSNASRVAYSLFTEIVMTCDALIDLHTGSYYRENLPQLRADIAIPQVSDMVNAFGAMTALQSPGPKGSLRKAATSVGIPAVVMEIGGPLSLDPEVVDFGVKSIQTFLNSLGMIKRVLSWSTPQPVFYSSEWIRSDAGGIFINEKKLGAKVKKGTQLAVIKDPITNSITPVFAPFNGVILGRAQNQFVSPGFALFRIGKESTPEDVQQEVNEEKIKAVEKATDG